jgi:hypothetical protein
MEDDRGSEPAEARRSPPGSRSARRSIARSATQFPWRRETGSTRRRWDSQPRRGNRRGCRLGQRRRRDVPEEAGMSVKERMVEQQLRRRFKQRAGLGASFRQRTREVERFANGRGRFVVGHGTARHGFEKLRELVDESMPEGTERRRVHRKR